MLQILLQGVALLGVLLADAADEAAAALEHGSAVKVADSTAGLWKAYPGAAISNPQVPPPQIPCHSATGCVKLKKIRLRELCSRYPDMPNCKDLYSCVPGGCGNGECERGYCRCFSGYMGPSCKVRVLYLPIGMDYNASHFSSQPIPDAPRPIRKQLGNFSSQKGPTWSTVARLPLAGAPSAAPSWMPPGSPTFTVAGGGGLPAAAFGAGGPAAAVPAAAFAMAPSPAAAPSPAV